MVCRIVDTKSKVGCFFPTGSPRSLAFLQQEFLNNSNDILSADALAPTILREKVILSTVGKKYYEYGKILLTLSTHIIKILSNEVPDCSYWQKQMTKEFFCNYYSRVPVVILSTKRLIYFNKGPAFDQYLVRKEGLEI